MDLLDSIRFEGLVWEFCSFYCIQKINHVLFEELEMKDKMLGCHCCCKLNEIQLKERCNNPNRMEIS